MLFCCWRLQSFAHPVYNLDDGSGLYSICIDGVLACGNRWVGKCFGMLLAVYCVQYVLQQTCYNNLFFCTTFCARSLMIQETLVLKEKGNFFLHGDLICRYILSEYMILSVVTYLVYDDIAGWTDYVNKHCMLRWSRQSGNSGNEEEVSTGRGNFTQPYAFEPTSASVNYHYDADSETTGSDDDGMMMMMGDELEVANRTSGTYLTANGENWRSYPCTSLSNAMNTRNIFTTEHRGVTSQ